MQDKSVQYEAERERRWSMAKEGEPIAIKTIENRLSTYYGVLKEAKRYDEQYFIEYDPCKEENSWVRGASDYIIEIDGEEVLIEIKLKNGLKPSLFPACAGMSPYPLSSFFLPPPRHHCRGPFIFQTYS